MLRRIFSYMKQYKKYAYLALICIAVEAMLDGIQEALGRNEDVVILGFGSFSVVDRAPRAGRHPQTGKPMHIPATRQARFKPGKTLKELVK